ncbi:hypothetical protein [Spirochaeta cellobiosiphila]|uniref:hypothetical protein n=1 Tax=Spirochaeta cellobiosiphila TaxID=504483 RepID=UPI0003FC0181|nr:hypothetical protein [Spirochaeta cellobiosiphila]
MNEYIVELEYKSYRGKASWDRYSKKYHGDIVGVREFIPFVSSTRVDLESVFEITIENYINSNLY